MNPQFLRTLKDMYNWQERIYNEYNVKMNKGKETKSFDIYEDDKDNVDDKKKYVVIKKYHPDMDNIWILALDKETYMPCNEDHVERLLELMYSFKPSGCTKKEIINRLKMGGLGMDREIILNIQAFINHFISIGLIYSIYNYDSDDNIDEKKELDTNRYRLGSYEGKRDNHTLNKLIQISKMFVNMPVGCSSFHISEILTYFHMYSKYGASIAELVFDMDNESIHLYKNISKNAKKWVEYCVKMDLLELVE